MTTLLPTISKIPAGWTMHDCINAGATPGQHFYVYRAAPPCWLPLCAALEAPAYITAPPHTNACFPRFHKAEVDHPCGLRLVLQAALADQAGALLPLILTACLPQPAM